MVAALATMVIGALGAIAQEDLKRVLSFTLVGHIGYLLFGVALATPAGLGATIFYVVHHITVQATLFCVAGLIERGRRVDLDDPAGRPRGRIARARRSSTSSRRSTSAASRRCRASSASSG